MKFDFREKDLITIRDNPHLLGHLVGKEKLSDIHSKWIKYIWDSREHKSLQGHRGSYKTTAVTEIGSLWWLLFHPNDRIAIIRKPYTEAAKTLRTIRDYFKLETIEALFYFAHKIRPQMVQKKEKSIIFNFKSTITKEGSLDAYGVDGNLTGNHYDKIICDDFITLKDRVSRAEREKTKESVREIITNIIDPGKQCGFIGTPWHKDDAWQTVPEPIQYDIEATGILSESEITEKQKRTTKALFACNYLLKHVSRDDTIFSDPFYDRWDYQVEKIYGHLDAKYSGECTAALTFMGERRDGWIQAVGFVFEENVKDKLEYIEQKYKRYRACRIFNEENPDKGFTADELNARHLHVGRYHENMNKHIKIVSYLKKYWDRILWATETQPEYMEQITDYIENQKPDDAPDSAASLLREAFYAPVDAAALYQM